MATYFWLLLLMFGGTPSAGQECDNALSTRAQQDVRTITNAVYQGDVDTVLNYTHPGILQLQGGRDAARRLVENALAAIQKSNISIERLTFPSAPTCLTVEGRRFIIVPTLSILTAGNQRVESLNYQFGVAEPGQSHLTYAEGSRINAKTVQILFPGFPRDFKFPQTYRKAL